MDNRKNQGAKYALMTLTLKGRIETQGFFAGLGVNGASILLFLLGASRLTASSPLSTFVLTYAPLLEGALLALTVLWAAQYLRRMGHKNGFAAGLMFGIPSQIGGFAVWHLWWVRIYAG